MTFSDNSIVDLNEYRGRFTKKQVDALLRPISPKRVLYLDGMAHVSQQDITAHLVRIFGFGSFDIDVTQLELLYETSDEAVNRAGKKYLAWDVSYRAAVRLTVRNPNGEKVCHYENGSVGTARRQPNRGDAHDLAYKSAISLSIKRAAIPLGDQFGLSLYNKGQLEALVIDTLVDGRNSGDVQANVPAQVALGNDEIDRSDTDG